MADGYWNASGQWVNSASGSRANDSGDFDELKTTQLREKFDAMKGWSGIAGVRKKPKDYEAQFKAWLATQTKPAVTADKQKDALTGKQ